LKKLKEIEEMEKEVLFKLAMMFKNSIVDFSTSMDRSLNYLDKIVLPIIMASQQNKSYNPFAEIIEKYVLHILIRKFEKEDYNLLPLGYSSDLTLENREHILSIDIKTANIENPSDFNKTINVGINQMTHVAKLPIGKEYLPEPFFVYPNLPPFYKMPNCSEKLILTYGLMFIYPSYSDLIEEINESFKPVYDFFHQRTKEVLTSEISNRFNILTNRAQEMLEKKAEKTRYPKIDLITESLLRGIFIHQQEKENILTSLQITQKEENEKIEKFLRQLENFITKLRERDIKPIAIIVISLPNGLLKEKYLDRCVSGKDYARSSRYHYNDGIFEVLKEETGKTFPRVVFVDLKEEYLNELKKYFNKIIVLDYELKEL
jgi:hypothetical protein